MTGYTEPDHEGTELARVLASMAGPPAPLVLPPDEDAAAASARQLIAQAKAADDGYKVAAVRAAVYTFLHQYGRSELPAFKVAIDLAVSLRKIIDDLDTEGPGNA